ncbi:MAG TPA: hypothetical protein VFZ24_01240 [Longimicrobiales bacterium]
MTLMLLSATQSAATDGRVDVLAIGFIAGALLMIAVLVYGIVTTRASKSDGQAPGNSVPGHRDGLNSKERDE